MEAPWELGEHTGLTGLEISEGLCAVPQSLLWKALCFFPCEKPRVHQTWQPSRASARVLQGAVLLGEAPKATADPALPLGED